MPMCGISRCYAMLLRLNGSTWRQSPKASRRRWMAARHHVQLLMIKMCVAMTTVAVRSCKSRPFDTLHQKPGYLLPTSIQPKLDLSHIRSGLTPSVLLLVACH